ncbi:response regulator [Phaeodactylibacter xiamenensis]|mgnify:CR=1 FL=1|uniref:response regulator n=1 Tax=Phaeodactylibacter xiamenensis TaxID=1524460 RepID=UPI0024A8E9BB|nr:response regulator [Phaeodactylibacter xiamenensis]
MDVIIKKNIDYYFGGNSGKFFFSYPTGIYPLNWIAPKTESSLDQVMHDFVQKHVTTLSTATIVFIPLALSRDYISLTGLRLGMHIRLTAELGEGRKVPIIFMGEETYEQVGRLSPLGSFLFTQGVDLIKEDNNCILEAVEKWKSFKLSSDYLDEAFLERVAVQPPDFYDSKHTLSNELSLLYLDRLSGHNVLENKKELELVKSSLYVKWVLARQQRSLSQMQEGQANNLFTIEKAKGKRILLIDDERKKGWYDLLECFFQGAKEFECLEIERSDTIQKLESKLNSKIQQKDWDLFLLDIRLLDKDHYATTDFSNFSGFTLLKLIKQNNEGNQVILFSASHQHEIYDYGKKTGADEIWIKPEVSYTLLKSGVLEKLDQIVNRCLDRKWFKDVFQQVDRFNAYLDFERYNLSEDEEELYDEIAWLLKGATQILRFETELSKQLFVLLIFKIIEECNDHYIGSSKADYLKFKDDGEKVKDYTIDNRSHLYVTKAALDYNPHNSARNRFFAVCHQKWGHKLDKETSKNFVRIEKLGKKRNELIHKEKAISELPLDESQLLSWLTALVSLLLRGK